MAALRALFIADGPSSGGAVAAALGADRGIDLVGRASGAAEGVPLIETEAPEVVVIYASAAPGEGRVHIERTAAAMGSAVVAVDATGGQVETFESLCRRVKAAAASAMARPKAGASPLRAGGTGTRLIAIGASTGGVEALVEVLSRFPRACPPTVVVQHMPAFFTTSFAARLNSICQPAVHEAWDGAPLDRGTIYLAPGGATHLEVVWNGNRRVRLTDAPPVNRHRPSVDVAFRSVARQTGEGVVGVLLTGMGRDGAEGLRAMRNAGARTIAQDRASSVVYGMPRAALECGAVDQGTPLTDIAAAIFEPEAQTKEAVAWR
jgi:two-component system chemotaxis response regulator CheB